MHVVPSGAPLVKVPLALDVHQIQFIDQALALEHSNGAVHGNTINAGVNFARSPQNLPGVEVLSGGFDDAEDSAALASQTDSTLQQLRLQKAWSLGLR